MVWSRHWERSSRANAEAGPEGPACLAYWVERKQELRPGAGLGPEASGQVPDLVRGDWRKIYTHASVSFGHELLLSAWQYAAAMATVARGGTYRPLRLVRAAEQGDKRWEIAADPGRSVLSPMACESVRAMMALAAETGTGRHVASSEQCGEFAYIGTKTGTTEKVETEVSLHVEWPRQIELAAAGKPWSRSEYKALVGKRANLGLRQTCYTSSMCAIGALQEGGRELLVFVVVDEPRSRRKFGSDVAGPTTVRILRRAHGLRTAAESSVPARRELSSEAFSISELPWTGEEDW